VPHHTSHRNWLVSLSVIILLLTAVTPALADYIGPNRTVPETSCKVILNECQYVEAKGEYRYKMVDSWSCSNESKPWQEYPNDPPRACTASTTGDKYWSREDEVIGTTTHPPATINGTLQNCTLQNGWCITPAQLSLTGAEPVAGYYIFAIEGTRNGQVFGCTTASCSVPLNQGNNNFTFWALSSFGDSSTMGSLAAKVDSQIPNITGSLSGTVGSNGWYTSSVLFNGSASDTTSGLASFSCTLDGTALGSCNTITINANGPHTLVLTARDNAGHTRTLTHNASVDMQNPALSAALSGTMGSNNWYTAAQLNASASDPSPGSGLSSFEYNLDGAGWKAFPASGTLELTDGEHTVNLRAADKAGRTVTTSKSFKRDTVAPNVSVNAAGNAGLNNWYVANPIISASASDATSGMSVFEYSFNNGAWQSYTAPFSLEDGTHTLSFWAEDAAGLVTQVERTYQVDTREPQVGGSLSGTPGANDWYTSEVILSVIASDPAPGSGIDSLSYVLDNNAEAPYTDPITLPDGKHTLQLYAKDKAGLAYSIQQSINVDTIHPAVKIETELPAWIKDSRTLSGTASDSGSGLSELEISVDDGQTWQGEIGTDSWSHTWNTLESPNGIHQVRIRATDLAGLVTQQSIDVGVDNRAPEISVPASWFQWDAVTLDIWDSHSGLSEARVEIVDPTGRRPARVIQLDPQQFPLSFKWDRRFGDNTLADAGTYDVKITASDNLGNSVDKVASIKIVLDILPAGPTATLQPYVREAPTPTATPDPVTVPGSTPGSMPVVASTPTSVTRIFGGIEPTAQPTYTPASTSTPRVMPTYENIVDYLESFFVPPDVSEEQVIEIGSPEQADEASQPTPAASAGVLWGTAATAAISAAAAYAYEEKRKYEEELARQAELEAAKEERRKKIQERQLEKLEEKWAQERAWEEARQEALKPNPAYDVKAGRFDQEETAIWVAGQEAIKRNYEERKKKEEEEKKKVEEAKQALIQQAGVLASLAAMKAVEAAQEAEAPQPEPNWWEKAKSLVDEKIIQPANTYIYQPLIQSVLDKAEEALDTAGTWVKEKVYEPVIKPALEKSKEFIESETSWIKENLYEPYVKPATQKLTETVTKGITWINKEVYQPYIQPAIKKTIEHASSELQWLNENIYQPYIQPAVKAINENVYQPYIQPVVEKVNETANDFVEWVDETVYQPFIKPVVDDINQNLIQPIVKKTTDWWEDYGEWVHAALDVAGFVPGLGEIADGLNGLIYLAEGNYLDASLSLISMIPVVGDLSKGAKWTVGLGQELLDQAVKELAEESAEKLLKEAGEEVLEKSVKEAGEELAENVTKETLEEGAEKLFKEAGEELIEKTAKEIVEESTEKTVKEIGEEAAEQVSKTVTEKTVKEVPGAVKAPAVPTPPVKKADDLANNLIKEHGQLAADVIDVVGPDDAKKLLETLDDKVLSNVVQQGPDALSALSKWNPEDLSKHGVELAQRAQKDAQAIADMKKLLASGPIDPKNLTKEQKALIEAIAANCTQLPGGANVVLGKWTDISSGFVKHAQETGAVHYNPHPELWELLAGLGPQKQSEVAWLINQQVVQTGINKGMPFEYTLNGVPADSVNRELAAVRAIFSGKSDVEVLKILKLDKMPIRMQELWELHKGGYEVSFDAVSNSFTLIKP
jgi:hypothetical protein